MRGFLALGAVALGLASPAMGQISDVEAGLALYDCLEQDDSAACDTVMVAGPAAFGEFFEEEAVSAFYVRMANRIPELIAARRPACDANDHVACFEIANLLGATNADPPMESLALFVAACDAGLGEACVEVSTISIWSNARADQSTALVFYKDQARACDDGDASACLTQARLNTRLRDIEADPDIWETHFEAGCDANIGRACEYLSNAYGYWGGAEYPSLRSGVRASLRDNLAVALTYAEKACDLGNPIGCWNAASAYRLGDGVAENVETARLFDQRACKFGMFAGCGSLGTEPEWYSSRDAAALQADCDAGDQTACYVGFARADDVAEGADPTVIAQLEMLCTQGAGDACGDVAKRYYDAGQLAKAERLAFAACNFRTDVACGVMGNIYRYHRGTPDDMEAAYELYYNACGFEGTAWICFEGADMIEKGLNKWPDANEASELYYAACDLGREDACALADTVYDRMD